MTHRLNNESLVGVLNYWKSGWKAKQALFLERRDGGCLKFPFMALLLLLPASLHLAAVGWWCSTLGVPDGRMQMRQIPWATHFHASSQLSPIPFRSPPSSSSHPPSIMYWSSLTGCCFAPWLTDCEMASSCLPPDAGILLPFHFHPSLHPLTQQQPGSHVTAWLPREDPLEDSSASWLDCCFSSSLLAFLRHSGETAAAHRLVIT